MGVGRRDEGWLLPSSCIGQPWAEAPPPARARKTSSSPRAAAFCFPPLLFVSLVSAFQNSHSCNSGHGSLHAKQEEVPEVSGRQPGELLWGRGVGDVSHSCQSELLWQVGSSSPQQLRCGKTHPQIQT